MQRGRALLATARRSETSIFANGKNAIKSRLRVIPTKCKAYLEYGLPHRYAPRNDTKFNTP